MSSQPDHRNLVERHGVNAMAAQTLNGHYKTFFHGDGCIAYVDTGSALVAAGAPLAPRESIADLTVAFLQHARQRKRRCCFFAVERRFINETRGLAQTLRIGEQAVWDPQNWTATLARHPSLRQQVRRAAAKGVTISYLSPDDPMPDDLRQTGQKLLAQWQATRGLPPMGFVVAFEPSDFAAQKPCFIAQRHGVLVGMAHVIKVAPRNGWFVEHSIRAPKAPNGTIELLIDAIMKWSAASGSRYVTLGLAPLAGEVALPLRWLRRKTRLLYDFEGLYRFKAKLRPHAWQPIWVAYPPSQNAAQTVIDVLAAFAQGGFIRFGGKAILRGSPFVVATLAALLAPWTMLIAWSDADTWFAGHTAVKWGWVAFDSAVLLGLVRLLRKPSLLLANVLCAAVMVDAFVTPIEAAFWNLSRISQVRVLAIVGAACLAPFLATMVMLGVRRRLGRLAA